MTQVRVTLSANAGVSIESGKYRIWVDALHKDKQAGFSAVTPELYRQVLDNDAFKVPNYICVTHCHPDHYCEAMLEEARKRWPTAQLCLPKQEAYKVEDENLTLEFICLPHEGAQYSGVIHCGILICVGGINILIAGDCETASPALREVVGDRQIDLAILNFPWVTLSKGRAFLMQNLKPKHILLCHLPFEADDVGGFRCSAQRNAQLLAGEMDIRLLCEPLQSEIVNI